MIGLDDNQIEKLRIAGLLHDIGKLYVPLSILDKPAKLTDDEYNVIKRHPLYGIKLLNEANFVNNEILNMILCHHEKIDGTGYPLGLKGKSIPQLAKIITICDSFDAMHSRRVYKDADDLTFIKKELLEQAGKQFDYDYVNLFIVYLENVYLKSKETTNASSFK